MASTLWNSNDPQDWLDHLGAARGRLQALQDVKLVELEEWFWEQLPILIRERSPSHIKGEELVKLVEWKLKRGKWRPRLLDYARLLKEEDVQESSTAAFTAAGKITSKPDASAAQDGQAIKDALRPLTELKGVGPATASAILTAFSPDVPFMSDESMAAALTGPKEYTLARYLEFAHAVRLRAEEITTRSAEQSNPGKKFTAQDVEKALWSEAIGQKPQKKATGKRKR